MIRASTNGGLLKGAQGSITFRSKEGGKRFSKEPVVTLFVKPFQNFLHILK